MIVLSAGGPEAMMLKMSERKALTGVVSKRYRAAGKKEKGLILDQFTADTGYDRSYARTVLRNFGRKIHTAARIYVGGKAAESRGRKKQYDGEVLAPLITIWKVLDYPCGKRAEHPPMTSNPFENFLSPIAEPRCFPFECTRNNFWGEQSC